MPSSISLLEAKIGPSWAHLGTSSGQMDLQSASTMWTSFSPLGCAAHQLCSMNMLMPFNTPCRLRKCRTCYTTWMITLLLVHQTPQFVPTRSWPWLLHVRSFTLLSILKQSQKPATTTNFLWLDINSVAMEARIDPSCLLETISLLEDTLGHQSTTKQTSIIDRQTSFCVRGLQAWKGLPLLHDQNIHESSASPPQDQAEWGILSGCWLVAAISAHLEWGQPFIWVPLAHQHGVSSFHRCQ